jgi:YHS domain-containing protein
MNFIALLVRFLLWLVASDWRRMIERSLGAKPNEESGPGGTRATHQKLVRDPVCGMHVAASLALSLREGTETVFFCSSACLESYRARTRRFAATG